MTTYELIKDLQAKGIVNHLIKQGLLSGIICKKLRIFEGLRRQQGCKLERYENTAKRMKVSYGYVRQVERYFNGKLEL